MFHAIDIAISQLGVLEATGHNDGVPSERYMRGDNLAWCAGFALWCFESSDNIAIWDAGLGPDEGADSDYWKLRKVSTMKAYLDDRGLGLGGNIVPHRNDLVFFGDRGASDAGDGSHVGIVEAVNPPTGGDQEGWSITTIEGNLGNKVSRLTHQIPNSRIIGFARVTGVIPGDLR